MTKYIVEQALLKLPRVRLAHLPTPLEEMANLSARLGGPRLLVKRDDCTGVAMGGNKARQAEWYFGAVMAAGADTVITTGAVQSNRARMTCAYARRLGLACEIQLEHRVKGQGEIYAKSGNVLLNRLLGARIHEYPDGEDEKGADENLALIAARVKSEGGKLFVIPLSPDHPPVGALGYLEAASEILGQAAAMEAILTGEPIPAERAYALGLLSRLVEPGEAVDEAHRLARQITACAPLAVWESRAIVRAAATEDDETLKRMTDEAFGRIIRSEDTKEGLEAFIEKRAPDWRGR